MSGAGTGAQAIFNYPRPLDSGFRRNDREQHIQAFYEAIKIRLGRSFLDDKFGHELG